jgi:hypothetical protein
VREKLLGMVLVREQFRAGNFAHLGASRELRQRRSSPSSPWSKRVWPSAKYPDVPEAWRPPDFSVASEPVLGFRLRRDSLELAFLTTVAAFNAPQNVTLEEVRIESDFPADDASASSCERLAREDP